MHAQHTIDLAGTARKINLRLFTTASFQLTLLPDDIKQPTVLTNHNIIDFARTPLGGFRVPAGWTSCTITVLYDDRNVVLVCENAPTGEDLLRFKIKDAIARRLPRDKAPPFLGLLLPQDRLLKPALPAELTA